ncbi:protein C3orf33 homolog isoform X6 [Balaenoptera acutorostrata]|uniref:Protein C3orf33 homolog isoform X6 n=1 Tax=Balaenoptera acutorostrata TaxID=9767 RepID=A0ABM3TI02_BALAC|nr:protein C3orf33 homolog isoform X6 [Balaenoptera acutorostrata]
MAGRPAAAGTSPPDRDRAAPNVVAWISQWADDHLRLVRNISTVMAIAGVMLLLRSVRLIMPSVSQKCCTELLAVEGLLDSSHHETSKFTSSSDIPVEFIRRNVKLRGRLHRITENGFEIEHIPITLPILSSWRKEPCGALLVKLAGVELTETGKVWLQKELKPSQVVWFQLLGKENSALFCYLLVNKVKIPQGLWK